MYIGSQYRCGAFQHKLSRQLVEENQFIGLEDGGQCFEISYRGSHGKSRLWTACKTRACCGSRADWMKQEANLLLAVGSSLSRIACCGNAPKRSRSCDCIQDYNVDHMLKNITFTFRLGALLLILMGLASGCANVAKAPEPARISIATRGESLNNGMGAPEPIVLPAATAEDIDDEAPIDADPVEDCAVSGNLQFESEVVALVNQARSSAGLPALREHALLTQVARQHSEEMACGAFLSHDSPFTGSVENRVESTGYQFASLGENVAMGYESPEAVVDAWLTSEGQKENVLSADYTQIGVGFAQLSEDGQARYWTIVLAAPKNP